MSNEMMEIIKNLDSQNIEIQLALQCAPLIMGLKVSNLLIFEKKKVSHINDILKNTDISYSVLLTRGDKMILLLYKINELEKYLSNKDVINMLKELGYSKFKLEDILSKFRLRYKKTITDKKDFPHEMGLLLGYPIEDVRGFIENNGKNFLYSGYWKVYENMQQKIDMFNEYELAKEKLIYLVSNGISIEDTRRRFVLRN